MSLSDYDYFVAHTNMMAEILPLRGLLKRKLPNVKNGKLWKSIVIYCFIRIPRRHRFSKSNLCIRLRGSRYAKDDSTFFERHRICQYQGCLRTWLRVGRSPFWKGKHTFSRLSLFSHWQSTMWLYNSAINSKGNVLCIQIFSGCLECTQLTMPMEELEANFSIILKDIESCRARTSGSFVTRCYVLSPPSPEYFVVKTEAYIKKKAEDTSSSSSSDDDSDNENEKPDEEEGQNTSRARVAKQ